MERGNSTASKTPRAPKSPAQPKPPQTNGTNANHANVNGQASGSGSQPPPANGPKRQKDMTKEERREQQERQRAAKTAAKAAPPTASDAKSAPPRTPKAGPSKVPSTPTSTGRRNEANNRLSRDFSGLAAEEKPQARGLRIFSHFGLPKVSSAAKGDVHPAVVRLGLQFSQFKIVGANARCIATLTAFKQVIQDYVTPPNNTLSRHLMTHLSPQISHLVSARPMSVTMGNAIRQLKLEISGSDIDLPEQDAKDALCRKIDDYIRDRITIADQVIQETAGRKIKDGDTVLTYARSSVVEKVLLCAHDEGKQFNVIVVDSRPLLEGKRLLSVLAHAGIPCTYALLPSVGPIIPDASLVLAGAHSLHANGAVYARAGTALVAMLAARHSVPVVVCCETYKFSENVQLDGFIKNELAPAGESFSSSFPLTFPPESAARSGDHLEVLNPLYDLTPPTSITAVVTEVGIIPPSSISSIPLALGRQTL